MPIYCKVTRGNHVESQHSVYAVAVNEVGEIIFSTGDPDYQICIRSSFKPFQAAASVHAGAVKSAGFTDTELALMCASHNGEEIHVKTAKSMMNKLGFSKDHYECGIHAPYDKESKIALLHKKKDYSPFNNNCSGKHAGMLALAKHLGVKPAGYTNRDHPVQKTIFDLLRIYSGQNEFVTAIDGCSAPTPFMSLHSIALLFQKLASGQYAELKEVYQAMAHHPYLVAGRNRFDTDFIKVMKGKAITKVGGEAVRGVAIRNKNGETFGLALKVLDGNQRANPVATLALLDHLKFIEEEDLAELKDYRNPKLFNHRKIQTGDISAHFES